MLIPDRTVGFPAVFLASGVTIRTLVNLCTRGRGHLCWPAGAGTLPDGRRFDGRGVTAAFSQDFQRHARAGRHRRRARRRGPPARPAGAAADTGLRTVPTFCDLCFWKGGAIATVRDGRLWKIEGNPEDPLSRRAGEEEEEGRLLR